MSEVPRKLIFGMLVPLNEYMKPIDFCGDPRSVAYMYPNHMGVYKAKTYKTKT